MGMTTNEATMTIQVYKALKSAKDPRDVLFYGWHVDGVTRKHGWYYQHPCKQEFVGKTLLHVRLVQQSL